MISFHIHIIVFEILCVATTIHSELSNVINVCVGKYMDDMDIITGFSNEYRTEAFGS